MAVMLHANVAAADPSSLRGMDVNSTLNATLGLHLVTAPLEVPMDPASSTPEALQESAPVLTEAVAHTVGHPAEDGDTSTDVNLTDTDVVSGESSSGGSRFYWDGQCAPCPVYLYRHCSRGGRLAGKRNCCRRGSCSYCEGRCKRDRGPPAAAQDPEAEGWWDRRRRRREPRRRSPPPQSARRRAPPRRRAVGVRTLYHETSPQIAAAILSSGFRPGGAGWCGGAIYFYSSPQIPATKLGPQSHSGAVIEAKVSMGRTAYLDSQCRGHEEARRNYDSIMFNPGDGEEFIVFSGSRVVSMRRYS